MIENDDDRTLAEHLYIIYRDKVYNVAYKKLNNVAESEDAVSETFERVVNHISDFRDKSCNETEGSIVLIVKNICIDKLRRTKKIKFVSVDEKINMDDDIFETEDISNIVIDEAMYEKILDEVNSLSDEYKIVVMLKSKDYSNKEISEMLNISEENVRVRYHRAIQKLKKKLIRGGEVNEDE